MSNKARTSFSYEEDGEEVNLSNDMKEEGEDSSADDDIDDSQNNYPICFSCKSRIREVKCVVLGQKKYHIDHFNCSVCLTELVSKPFYESGNSVLCATHYQEVVAPNCKVCSLFISGKYVSAKGFTFHVGCLACTHCGIGIEVDEEFYFEKKDVVCKKCKRKHAPTCSKCKKHIFNNDEIVSFQKYFHPACVEPIANSAKLFIESKGNVQDSSQVLKSLEMSLLTQASSSFNASLSRIFNIQTNSKKIQENLTIESQDQNKIFKQAQTIVFQSKNSFQEKQNIKEKTVEVEEQQDEEEEEKAWSDTQSIEDRANDFEKKFGMTIDQLNEQFAKDDIDMPSNHPNISNDAL